MSNVVNRLPKEKQTIIEAVKKHSQMLLDNTSRFKYFTLHGTQHINNLFKLLDIFENGGLRLTDDQAFLLSCAICTHDLGMIVPLSGIDVIDILEGKSQSTDPTNIENYIRDVHNELVINYISDHFDFLTSLGLSPNQCSLVSDIAKGHRKGNLSEFAGYTKPLGALLRLIDELDISPERAPSAILLDHFEEMDSTSCWHWFKHNISEEWMTGHNINFESGAYPKINFKISVRPPSENSIQYWLHQIMRPLKKTLIDEKCGKIIREQWGIDVTIQQSIEGSSQGIHNAKWLSIENKALSNKRKSIIVIDDEVRKMEDLFLPLMRDYHITFSSNLKDAFQKLEAISFDLAIIDLQMGASSIFTTEETENYKMTGLKISETILSKYPKTKIGILTGSRYDLTDVKNFSEKEFLLKKPVDPETFEKEVKRVLQ